MYDRVFFIAVDPEDGSPRIRIEPFVNIMSPQAAAEFPACKMTDENRQCLVYCPMSLNTIDECKATNVPLQGYLTFKVKPSCF